MSTRDYKPRAGRRGGGRGNARSRRAASTPRRWPWFVGGFGCGLLVAWVVYVREYSPETWQLVASQSQLLDEAGRQAGKPAEPGAKPRFEFYTLLPEMEVEVPERELEAAARREQRRAEEAARERARAAAARKAEQAAQAERDRETAAAPVRDAAPPAPRSQPAEDEPSEVAPAPDENSVYMLQVASFKSAAEADRLKASLTLMGLTPSIQTVSVNGEATWFRVRVGPYADIARLNDARTRLREHDLEPLVLKVRG